MQAVHHGFKAFIEWMAISEQKTNLNINFKNCNRANRKNGEGIRFFVCDIFVKEKKFH